MFNKSVARRNMNHLKLFHSFIRRFEGEYICTIQLWNRRKKAWKQERKASLTLVVGMGDSWEAREKKTGDDFCSHNSEYNGGIQGTRATYVTYHVTS